MATKTKRKDRRRSKRRGLKRHKRQETRLVAKAMRTVRKRHEDRFGVSIGGPIGGMRKLSEVIKEFAEPLIDGVRTTEELNAGVSTAVLAWNMAIMPRNVRKQMLGDLADRYGSGAEVVVIRAVLGDMMARKKALYDDDKRFVMDYQVTRISPDDCHLAVAYAMFE